MFARQRSTSPRKRDVGPGKGRIIVAPRAIVAFSRDDAFAARRGDRDREFGRLALDRVEPGRIARAFLEQSVAAAQRALELIDARAVLGSIASTSRSRKRRRSLAESVNSPSIAGVSQTMRKWSAKARAEATGARSMRLTFGRRLAAAGSSPDAELSAHSPPPRPRSTPQSRRRRRSARIRRGRRAAIRVRARTATAPRADWSCRPRSRRRTRSATPRMRDRASHRSGNRRG